MLTVSDMINKQPVLSARLECSQEGATVNCRVRVANEPLNGTSATQPGLGDWLLTLIMYKGFVGNSSQSFAAVPLVLCIFLIICRDLITAPGLRLSSMAPAAVRVIQE